MMEPVKKQARTFEPTTFQLVLAICLFAVALLSAWEIPRALNLS
jgi:hypothetical protein